MPSYPANVEEELYLEISKLLIYYGVAGTDIDQCAHEIMDLITE